MSTTPRPQQRQHPGEGHEKCNPERDARAPMFPNQVDPPPERPWPATSDEGNSVPAPRPQRSSDVTSADEAPRPWTVVVEGDKIVGRYREQDAHTAGADVARLTSAGAHVDSYEAGACPPPQVGERVDPIALGWVKVG